MKFILKHSKKLFVIVLALMLTFTFTGCDKDNSGNGTMDGTVDYNGAINLFVPFDTYAYNGLERVKTAYRRLHPETRINITRGGDSYSTAVEGIILAPEETDIDIVQINVVSQYYGTDKIIDFTPYLNQRNPYGEEKNEQYPIWKAMLEEEAYLMEDNSYTVPSLSFESNYVTVCYSKQLFARYGWEAPSTWEDLLSLLADARAEGYTNPLGLNYDKTGVEGIMFGLLLQMYMDQYFRDIISVAHSQDGDYSYIDSVDYGWEYDSEAMNIDMRSNYTYNLSRLINAYFNGDSFNASSPRFADMMANIKELTAYSSSMYTSAVTRNYFHNGVLTELTQDNQYKKSETCVLFVNRMDYLSDFQSSIGVALGKANNVISADELEDYVGWFSLPAMTDNSSVAGGAPESESLRTFGGPNHHPMGVINRNDKKRTDLTMDFMKFWYSPQGMDEYYSYYSERGVICPLKVLVKDFELPSNMKINTGTEDIGICIQNPYFEMGIGYNDTILSSNGGTVRDNFVAVIREYLSASGSDWTTYGTRMAANIRSGFSKWAKYRNLKTETPYNITDYYQNTPFKGKQ